MKKLILIILFAALIFGLTACDGDNIDENGDFEIENIDGEIVLVYYYGEAAKVVIPDNVTVIGESAFANLRELTNVVIPDSVIIIGERAFEYCENLAEITIGKSVTSIGEFAFAYSGLTSIEIPDNVTEIGRRAFQNCRELTSVIIGNGVTSIENGTFARCFNLTTVRIGSNVTSIGNGAFSECTSLAHILIPDNVTSIDVRQDDGYQIVYGAFHGCENLTATYKGITYEARFMGTRTGNIMPGRIYDLPMSFYNAVNGERYYR
jgi:hypothetical protein